MDAEIAGTLGERVLIERWQTVRDAAGDDVGIWVAVDTVFAAVEPAGPLAPARGGDAARTGRRWPRCMCATFAAAVNCTFRGSRRAVPASAGPI
jgi:hypothetical protein